MLGVRRIPGWVDRVPRAASFIDQTSRTAINGLSSTAELARSNWQDLHEIAQRAGNELDVADTVEAVRRESVRTIDIACNRVADVTESVVNTDLGSTAQELGEAVVANAQALHETLRARTRDVGEELLGADIAELAQERAQAISQTVQESSQAISQTVQERRQMVSEKAQEIAESAQQLMNQDLSVTAQEIHEQASEQAQVLGNNLWKWGSKLRKAAARAMGEEPMTTGYGGARQGVSQPAAMAPAAAPVAVEEADDDQE